MQIVTNLKIERNKNDEIIGVSLTGDGSTEAKIYCTTFVKALQRGEANIRFGKNKIIFEHNKGEYPSACSFKRSADEIAILKTILKPNNSNLKAESSQVWCGSFKIYKKE